MSAKKVRKKMLRSQKSVQSPVGIGVGFGTKKYFDCPIGCAIEADAVTELPTYEKDGGRYVDAIFPVLPLSFRIVSKLADAGHDLYNLDQENTLNTKEAYDLNVAMLEEILTPDGWRNLVDVDGREVLYDSDDRTESIRVAAEAWFVMIVIRNFAIGLNQVGLVSGDDEKNSGSGSGESQEVQAESSEPTLTVSSA